MKIQKSGFSAIAIFLVIPLILITSLLFYKLITNNQYILQDKAPIETSSNVGGNCIKDLSYRASSPCISLKGNVLTVGNTNVPIDIHNDECTQVRGQVVFRNRLMLGCGSKEGLTLYLLDLSKQKVLWKDLVSMYAGPVSGIGVLSKENTPVLIITKGGYENTSTFAGILNTIDGEFVDLPNMGSTRYNSKYWFDYEPYIWQDNSVTVSLLELVNLTPKDDLITKTPNHDLADKYENDIENRYKDDFIQVVCHLGIRYAGTGNNDGCFGLVKVNRYTYTWD